MSETDGTPLHGDIKNHIQSQIRLNTIFLFYSLTTGAVIAYKGQGIIACASVVCTLGEMAYRYYSMYLLRQVAGLHNNDSPTGHIPIQRHSENRAHGAHLPSDAELTNEDNDHFPPDTVTEDLSDERPENQACDIPFVSKVKSENQTYDCFISACKETRYDPQKEIFCSGRYM